MNLNILKNKDAKVFLKDDAKKSYFLLKSKTDKDSKVFFFYRKIYKSTL